jgi:hypothetical protein
MENDPIDKFIEHVVESLPLEILSLIHDFAITYHMSNGPRLEKNISCTVTIPYRFKRDRQTTYFPEFDVTLWVSTLWCDLDIDVDAKWDEISEKEHQPIVSLLANARNLLVNNYEDDENSSKMAFRWVTQHFSNPKLRITNFCEPISFINDLEDKSIVDFFRNKITGTKIEMQSDLDLLDVFPAIEFISLSDTFANMDSLTSRKWRNIEINHHFFEDKYTDTAVETLNKVQTENCVLGLFDEPVDMVYQLKIVTGVEIYCGYRSSAVDSNIAKKMSGFSRLKSFSANLVTREAMEVLGKIETLEYLDIDECLDN